MATKDFEVNLKQELEIWSARVLQRVLTKFDALNINRTVNKKKGYTGDLYRTMYWEVYKASGGNKAMVQFFYMKYGDFVQWGVGRKFGDGEGQKAWSIPAVGGKDVAPIQAASGRNYFAKLFMRREVKYHARWLLKRLAEQYSYFGNLYIVRGLSEGVGDPAVMKNWIAENKDMLSKGILDWADIK